MTCPTVSLTGGMCPVGWEALIWWVLTREGHSLYRRKCVTNRAKVEAPAVGTSVFVLAGAFSVGFGSSFEYSIWNKDFVHFKLEMAVLNQALLWSKNFQIVLLTINKNYLCAQNGKHKVVKIKYFGYCNLLVNMYVNYMEYKICFLGTVCGLVWLKYFTHFIVSTYFTAYLYLA